MKKTASILKFATFIIGMMFSAMFFTGCGDDEVSGCTDPTADNYNAEATTDDGSCVISGCTDAEAENFNANATTDDGSCEYARDKFLGSYLGGLACAGALAPLINNDSLPFSIVEGLGGVETVLITLEGSVPVGFTGTVSGNSVLIATTLLDLPIDLTGDMIPEMVDLDVGGSITINGNDLTGTVEITVTDPIPLPTDNCAINGTKQ